MKLGPAGEAFFVQKICRTHPEKVKESIIANSDPIFVETKGDAYEELSKESKVVGEIGSLGSDKFENVSNTNYLTSKGNRSDRNSHSLPRYYFYEICLD